MTEKALSHLDSIAVSMSPIHFLPLFTNYYSFIWNINQQFIYNIIWGSFILSTGSFTNKVNWILKLLKGETNWINLYSKNNNSCIMWAGKGNLFLILTNLDLSLYHLTFIFPVCSLKYVNNKKLVVKSGEA